MAGRASSSATGVEMAPTDSTAGAGQRPEALAQCPLWFHLPCDWSCKQEGNISSNPNLLHSQRL